MSSPYARYVTGRDPVAVMADTIVRTRALVAPFTPERFERSYAEGKWSARELLIHLAHGEMVFGMRLRWALADPAYVIQPFDQDAWLALDRGGLDGQGALALFSFTRAFNLGLAKKMTAEDRARTIKHPEQGAITIEDVLVTIAGHELHHLAHFQQIASLA
jgi:hypothetical protein